MAHERRIDPGRASLHVRHKFMVGCYRISGRSSANGWRCRSSLTAVSEFRKIGNGACAPKGGRGSSNRASGMEKFNCALGEAAQVTSQELRNSQLQKV